VWGHNPALTTQVGFFAESLYALPEQLTKQSLMVNKPTKCSNAIGRFVVAPDQFIG
jgi:hypothetical protein